VPDGEVLGVVDDEVAVGLHRLGAVIGRGGIGEVYDARHLVTGPVAAVKLLRPDALGDQIQVQPCCGRPRPPRGSNRPTWCACSMSERPPPGCRSS